MKNYFKKNVAVALFVGILGFSICSMSAIDEKKFVEQIGKKIEYAQQEVKRLEENCSFCEKVADWSFLPLPTLCGALFCMVRFGWSKGTVFSVATATGLGIGATVFAHKEVGDIKREKEKIISSVEKEVEMDSRTFREKCFKKAWGNGKRRNRICKQKLGDLAEKLKKTYPNRSFSSEGDHIKFRFACPKQGPACPSTCPS